MNDTILEDGEIRWPDVEILGDGFIHTEFIAGELLGWHYVSHPRWSICGHGRTLTDAVCEAIKSVYEVMPHYCGVPINTLTAEAVEFRHWLDAR